MARHHDWHRAPRPEPQPDTPPAWRAAVAVIGGLCLALWGSAVLALLLL
jgi:hypothetical protein